MNVKDLFTPSPFARSSRIVVGDDLAVIRDLMEGPDEVYGMRRYLLLPRSSLVTIGGGGEGDNDGNHYPPGDVLASLNANRNVLFGARLHHRGSAAADDDDDDDDDYDRARYLAACGTLLDVAREDASINGQQVQALAALDGLCSWASGCLEDRDPRGGGGGGGPPGGVAASSSMSPAASARYDEISQRRAAALAEREASRILLREKEMLSGMT
jgi:hypothetical protein